MLRPIVNSVIIKYFLFVFVAIGCYACSPPQSPKQPKQRGITKAVAAKAHTLSIKPDTVIRADYNIDIFGNDDLQREKTQIYTFNHCKLLARPDSSGPVLKPLNAFVPLTYLRPIHLRYLDTLARHDSANDSITEYAPSFYEVSLGKQKGYLLTRNVAQCSITDKAGKVLYLLGADYRAANGRDAFIIKKVDLTSRQLIAVAYRSVIPDATLDVMLIKGNLLPGVKSMVKIVGHADMCGGGRTIVYLADAGRKLVALPDAFHAYDDGGGIFDEWMFLPRPTASGQWTLKTDTLGERELGNLKTLTNVPTQPSAAQLIVYTRIDGQFALDKNNQPISLKNGHTKFDAVPVFTTLYYQWTGQKLVQLPGTKKVKMTDNQFEAYMK